jgi:hypothetical protein
MTRGLLNPVEEILDSTENSERSDSNRLSSFSDLPSYSHTSSTLLLSITRPLRVFQCRSFAIKV